MRKTFEIGGWRWEFSKKFKITRTIYLNKKYQYNFWNRCFLNLFIEVSKIQSDYLEFAKRDMFLKQKMWFGLVLGQLAKLKKHLGGQLWATCKGGFSCFRGQKMLKLFFKNIAASALNSCIIPLELTFNRLIIYNQYQKVLLYWRHLPA